MPTRWSYEGLVYAQSKLNPLTIRQEKIQRMINEIIRDKNITEDQERRLDDLKETLALLSGLEAESPARLDSALRRIDDIINGKPFRRDRFERLGSGYTAEQLYVNQKVTDLISKAEMEQTDYRESRHINVFFGPIKEYFGFRAGMLWVNSGILVLSTLALFGTLALILRAQIRMRRR